MNQEIYTFETATPIIIDVGANTGTDSLPLARQFPSGLVYAFEPTPELANDLRSKSPSNYHVIEAAVDTDIGEKTFNVSGVGDWGRSSLDHFDPGAREAFGGNAILNVYTKQIIVNCTRLDHFCETHNITRIDYLHVDAQGNDLRVLQSLGDKITIVKMGVVEAARSQTTKLYGNSPTRRQMAQFLLTKGFFIDRVVPNDYINSEQNIYFY